MIKNEDTLNDKPPKFKSWKDLYMLVILNLAVLIALFYWLTVTLK
ncbi:hypothetical protein ACFLU5_05015 [Bacteroidota bacterium]